MGIKARIAIYGIVIGVAFMVLSEIPTTIGEEGTFWYYLSDKIGQFTIGFFAGIAIEKLNPFK